MTRKFWIEHVKIKAAARWDVELLDTTDKDRAIAIAKARWEKLGRYDQKHCDEFYLTAGEAEDPECEGYPDYDHQSTEIVWRAK